MMTLDEVVQIVVRSNQIAHAAASNRFRYALMIRNELMRRQFLYDILTDEYGWYFKERVIAENILAMVKSERNFFGIRLANAIREYVDQRYAPDYSLAGIAFYEPLSFTERIDWLNDDPEQFGPIPDDVSHYSDSRLVNERNLILSVSVMSIYRYIAIAGIVLDNDDGSDGYKPLKEMAEKSICYFRESRACFDKNFGDDGLFGNIDYDNAKCATRLYALKVSALNQDVEKKLTTLRMDVQ